MLSQEHAEMLQWSRIWLHFLKSVLCDAEEQIQKFNRKHLLFKNQFHLTIVAIWTS